MQDVLDMTGGQIEYRRTNGEISIVRIETAGMGMRGVRIANLPREVSDGVKWTALNRTCYSSTCLNQLEFFGFAYICCICCICYICV